MNANSAIQEYGEIVPQSLVLLQECKGKAIQQIVWHEIVGDDLYGRLLETLELRFSESSIYLRTPRHERAGDGDPVHTVEFVFRALPEREHPIPYIAMTNESETSWESCVKSNIINIELLVDLKDDRFARYYGIRFKLQNTHTIAYHYQWGHKIGDFISRHPRITIDGVDPPPELGWQFIHWI